MERRTLAAAAVATASLAGAASPALAYLDAATTILADVADRRAELDAATLVAEGYVPGQDPVVKAQTWLRTGRGMRTELGPEGGPTEVELVLDRDVYRFEKGGLPKPPTRVRAAPLLELLGAGRKDPGGQRGLALLARMRIDPEVVSLARFDGRPAYVIGAQPGDLDRPQLWIDKRFLVPVRWIVPAATGGLEDVRLYGYGMPTTGPWWPERIETWRGGERTSVIQYTRVELNAPAPARLFTSPTAAGG